MTMKIDPEGLKTLYDISIKVLDDQLDTSNSLDNRIAGLFGFIVFILGAL